MATFRCKRSGNTVSFLNEGDIQGLRKHEGYEEVRYEVKPQSTTEAVKASEGVAGRPNEGENGNDDHTPQKEIKVLKKRGRPFSK